VRLLVKNLGRGMPESVVREKLESLGIHVQGVTQLRSGRRDQDPAKDLPPTPHFIVSVARGPEVSKVRSITELCGLRMSVESYVAPEGPLQFKRCQRFGHTQRNCGYAPRCVACGGLPPLRFVLYPAGAASVLRLRGQPHGENSVLVLVTSHRKGSSWSVLIQDTHLTCTTAFGTPDPLADIFHIYTTIAIKFLHTPMNFDWCATF